MRVRSHNSNRRDTMQTPVNITRIPRAQFIAEVEKADEPVAGILPEQLPREFLSCEVETSVITSPSDPVPDCQECGVCCFLPAFIGVTKAECERVSDVVEVTVDLSDDLVIERYLRKDEITGRCSHLDGEMGAAVKCSIYADRPAVCRQFEAGSDKCHEFRRMCGLEPQLTKDEAAAAMSLINSKRRAGNEIEESQITEDLGFWGKVLWVLGYTSPKKPRLKIVAHLSDGSEHVIHRYDPEEETWYESDFWSITLDAARAMIAETREVQRE